MADPRDITGGVALAGVGGFFFAMSFGYGIGTVRNMGAGFLPMALGAALVVIGLAIAIRGWFVSGTMARPALRPLAATLAGVAAFIVTVRPLGLIPAIIATAILASLGDRASRPVPTAVFAVVLAVAIWAIFSPGLGLRIPGIRGVL